MLSHVLVNGVVGETGQRVRNFVDVDFGVLGGRGFQQMKDGVGDAAKFALGEKLGSQCACLL